MTAVKFKEYSLWCVYEQKTVSGETEYTVTCSSKFVPYEFPANEFSK